MDRMSSDLAPLREAFIQRRQEIRESFFQARDTVQTLHSLSEAVDELVSGICACAGAESDLFSILALGGYGRREQYPFSDVDLLFLYSDPEQKAAEKGITAVLHALWDSGLHLGHQVWSVDSLRTLSAEDFEFMLALLDARTVVAGPVREGMLQAAVAEALEPHRQLLIGRLVEATEVRHAGFRNTIYQLEPDLKQAPGGLRDYQAARWLQRLAGLLSPHGEADIEDAHQAISRLRTMLHFDKGRAQNQLTHRAQEDIARLNGYSEESLQSGVESLMMEYFLNAKILHSYCSRTVRTVTPGRHGVYLDCPVPPETANQVLDLFLHSIVSGKGLSDDARARIADVLPALSRTAFLPDVRYRLRDLMKPRPGLYRALSEMYELGFLELLFPEFGSIKARDDPRLLPQVHG